MEKRQTLTLTVLRQKVGMTQMDLALSVGTSQTLVSRWEKYGDIPTLKAEAITAVFRAMDRAAMVGMKPDDLSRPWEEVVARRVVAKAR